MKKPILFFTVATVVITTGCEYSCLTDFIIINQTTSTIDVNGKYEQIKIAPNDNEVIYHWGDLCGDRGTLSDRYSEYPDTRIVYDWVLVINGESIPEEIWTRKYWNFSSVVVRKATYTLTVTDELIETLLSENNQ